MVAFIVPSGNDRLYHERHPIRTLLTTASLRSHRLPWLLFAEILDVRGNDLVGTVPGTLCQDLVLLKRLLVDCSDSDGNGIHGDNRNDPNDSSNGGSNTTDGGGDSDSGSIGEAHRTGLTGHGPLTNEGCSCCSCV